MAKLASLMRPDAKSPGPAAMIAAVLLSLAAAGSGVAMSGDAATTVACVALLVFGLPHGTLDLEIIRARRTGPITSLLPLLSIYLGLAAAMYVLWRLEPVLALGAFIGIAVIHFAEDWNRSGSTIMASGLALAMLCAPTLMHRAELDAIFIGLTNREAAPIISQGLALVFPLAFVIAMAALLSLWRNGGHVEAIGGITALTAMLVLPPIIGFAAYFCLFHSPRHFAHTLDDLQWQSFRMWGRVVLPLTVLAGLLATLVFVLEFRPERSIQIMAASFMTLSLLTVPHMLVPIIIARFTRTKEVQSGGAVVRATHFRD